MLGDRERKESQSYTIRSCNSKCGMELTDRMQRRKVGIFVCKRSDRKAARLEASEPGSNCTIIV